MHTISQIDGMPFANTDRVRAGMLSVAYGIGASAGSSVVVPVTTMLPPSALILTGGIAGAYVDVSAQTTAGFTLTITPRSNTATLAAGNAGIFVIA